MLVLRGSRGGSDLLLFVLEPGNIEKLKKGEPIHKFLNEFMPNLPFKVELLFTYSPDLEWVVEQIGDSRDMETVADVLKESLTRPEVLVRGKSVEDLKKVF